MDATKSGISGTSEGVLANFFNSLLKKSSSTTTPAGLLQSGGKISNPFPLFFTVNDSWFPSQTDRINASTTAPSAGTTEGTPPPGSPDKLNLMGRPEVAAELDRLAQSASARSNPQAVATNVDNTTSEC